MRSSAVALVAIAVCACADAKRQHRPLPEAFRALTLTDEVLDKGALSGRPWVISVWRPGCAACMRQLKALDQVKARHAADGVGFVALSLETDEQKIFDAAGQAEVDSTLAFCDGEVMGPLGLKSLPSTVFIDREAVIVASLTGEGDDATLEKRLKVAAP